jgi:tryptophan halogenase
MNGNIQRVAIAGGGIVAWSAAAALKRKVPMLDVIVIRSHPPPDALADRIANTLPSIVEFHADLGLSDEDTIVRAQSGFRLGSRFSGWGAGDYVHAYGSHGAGIGGVPFHQMWLREADRDAYDAYSLGADLGREERFAVSGTADATIGYGLRLTVERYCELISAYALHLGATERAGEIAEVELREDGFVAAIVLTDGTRVEGDLFVDCAGPAAAVRSRIDDKRESWSRWLLCDRVNVPGVKEESLLDEVLATSNGWSSASASAARGGEGIPIAQGRLAEPWVRNCVAIGDAAVSVEPLEWTNLHLAHSQIDRLVSMMPGKDCATVELAEYNRQCNAEADRVRDFLIMHYVTARRDEPFWKDAAAVELPNSLQHSLSLFAERGRLPYYEEETFTRDSWLAVLFGQGVTPRRVDPLAFSIPDEQVEETLTNCRQSIAAFVAAQPSYREFVSQMGQHARA